MNQTANADRVILDLNVKAPNFQLKDVFDRMINLEDYKGKRVFIGFFRHAGCPFCNLRVHYLQKEYEKLKAKNLEMIFFFESKEKILKASTFHDEISPIPLISDPEKVWYETYGIENSRGKSVMAHLTTFIQTAVKAKLKGLPIHPMADGESFNTIPAEFLLDENMIIRKIHYAKGLTDRLSIEHIHQFADEGKVLA
ncbi:MAG: peroxiredoxin-like family protein [Bacteroidota bacterium]